jgi:hypothetical protein
MTLQPDQNESQHDMEMLSISGSVLNMSDLSKAESDSHLITPEALIAEGYLTELLAKVWGQ